jgi:N-acetylglucosaminyl-diphospho-decaprenol L-rhamnosyltransferase
MASLDRITAVVLDWNLPDYTSRCVSALVEDGVPSDRIVIVENGPTAETWTRIRAEHTACVLVRIDQNAGFARANNIGARALPGDAYLFVNNDAFVHAAGSVGRLLGAVEQGNGIAVPRLLNEDLSLQPSVAPFTTPSVALVRASGLSRFVPNEWQPRLSTHWDHASSRRIESAIGPVLMVDSAAWEALGGFRETSFMYAEDLDLCWRADEQGLRSWFVAEAEFVHLGGTSSSTRWTSRERAARIGRAEAAMIREHLSPVRASLTLAVMRAGLAARIASFRAIGRNEAAESCRGFFHGYGANLDPSPKTEESELQVEVLGPVG